MHKLADVGGDCSMALLGYFCIAGFLGIGYYSEMCPNDITQNQSLSYAERKYDTNRDGSLDRTERQTYIRDLDFRREQAGRAIMRFR